MTNTLRLRSMLAVGVSAAALLGAAPVFAQTAPSTPPPANSGPVVGDIVVTAQRRSEAIQDVPVAVSAFSADTLKAQRLDGGDKLVLEVPNVNYSRGNFGGYNFSIRGIGTKSVAPSGDAGVSFNINNLPVAANHLGDTDFYDVDRVEVLRGPQGTLYGRAATGGAVNVIYAKPTDKFAGSITGEYGNYNTEKVSGFINLPMGDELSVRLAGFYLKRDGFGTNSVTGDDIDGRDLGSVRGTIAWRPNDNFRASLMYEHFNENDNRNRVGKQLCVKDPGPTSLGGVPLSTANQNLLSQGCKPGSLYSAASYGTVNSAATLDGLLGGLTGLTSGDVFANHPLQNHNLHDIESAQDPTYKAKENLAILDLSWDITNHLNLESLSGYNRNTGSSFEDYNRLVPLIAFNTTSPFFPGGVVNDPQLGPSNKLLSFDYGDTSSTEKTEELRLTSSFHGPLNFSVGYIYSDTQVLSDYYVMSNELTAGAIVNNGVIGLGGTGPFTGIAGPAGIIAIDPAFPPTGYGHNYYDSRSNVSLKSSGIFGEVYYQLTDDIKLTGGIRRTQDKKSNVFSPVELLAPGSGFGNNPTIQRATFNATTGRANIEWTPHFSFTNKSLIYATYSRGYQGGGFNTPSAGAASYPPTFDPVYVDAFEVGSKNVLLDGSLVLNLTGFYYKEQGYQISTIVNKSSVNQNINANLYGAELESLWSPIHNLTFNANIGYLHTEITSGSVLDQLNLTQGDPNLTLVKSSNGSAIGSNCVVNTAALAGLIAIQEGLPGTPNIPGVTGSNPSAVFGACSGGALAAFGLYNYAASPNVQKDAAGIGLGVPVNLNGKELPNSPEFTVSLGAQYVFELPGEWRATARADYYWQDTSYARIFNTVEDHLRSYTNVNATLTFDQRALGLNVQFYIKNAFDSQPITDAYLTDASSGLFTNVFTLDPRTYGISLTKRF